MAYDMAGIKSPLDEIDVMEVCEPTSFHEILWYEQLGLCPEGTGGTFLEGGSTSLQGKIPVNPSGGVLSTHPYVARGLVRVVEAALQLREEAHGHQIPNVRRALAHSVHGLGGQAHTVVILQRDD
jgi:acetyl-CoA C-acetyltransferase